MTTPAVRQRRGPGEMIVRLAAAAGLVVDAYVHVVLAGDYDANTGGVISQGALFRVEAGAAIVAALLVLFVRRRSSDVVVLLIAASAAAAVLVYRYVDLGPVFWMPDMYEPIWFPQKVVATVAELVATLTAAVLVGTRRPSPVDAEQ